MNLNQIDSVEALRTALEGGSRAKYLFFWGHRPAVEGVVDRACLSQWYPAPFQLEGQHYPTSEHFMMAEKARLFGDRNALDAILKCQHPGEAKQIGRRVQGFDETRWCLHRESIVVRGGLAKFKSDPSLRDFLKGTGHRILVEASPVDFIWGIGLAADHSHAAHPHLWQGLNLLGFALMKVRTMLLAEE